MPHNFQQKILKTTLFVQPLNQPLCNIGVITLLVLNPINQGLQMGLRMGMILILIPLHNDGEIRNLEETTTKSTKYSGDEIITQISLKLCSILIRY